MIKTISITLLPNDEKNSTLIHALIKKELKKAKLSYKSMTPVFEKKSIDARHGQVKLHLRYLVYLDEEAPSLRGADAVPEWKKADGKKSVIIVGAGPAGLFGALKLLEKGIKPIIIERGAETSQRKKDIAQISRAGLVNEDSNYCFGEGGAGTFSDGKLYTRSNKRGDISEILRIFAHFGADSKILTDAHPHIGTDRLPQVINAIRNKILECGGEIYFNTRCTEMIIKDGKIQGIKTDKQDFFAEAVLLATGHSAKDIYEMLARQAPEALEAKTFAAGVRVEHPRALIDQIQYHKKDVENLGAAEYRLTTQVDGRGVYSFCMCPGGFVVPSSSGPDEIVVNGMSAAGRNSRWSNAAIVVEIRPEDIPQEFKDKAEEYGCPALAGLFFRTAIEKAAQTHGQKQKAPAQVLTDFLDNKVTSEFPPVSYTPGIISSNLNDWLPDHILSRLKKAFPVFNNLMKGYVCNQAVMIAAETRTSTPVRICRNAESLECSKVQGLYPAGEGSGYAGGIVSSAMDGENCCKKIIEKIML